MDNTCLFCSSLAQRLGAVRYLAGACRHGSGRLADLQERVSQGAMDRFDGLFDRDKISPICTGDLLPEISLSHLDQMVRYILYNIIQPQDGCVQSLGQFGSLIPGLYDRGGGLQMTRDITFNASS